MTDIHSKKTRSLNMAAVKSKNTTPELKVRRLLHSNGYRFRLHNKNLEGKPDIVLKKHNAAIFIHGCFWHYHGCRKTNIPENNKDFWENKLNNNKIRDTSNINTLTKNGWRVAVIWECAISGKIKKSNGTILEEIVEWLSSQTQYLEIYGEQ